MKLTYGLDLFTLYLLALTLSFFLAAGRLRVTLTCVTVGCCGRVVRSVFTAEVAVVVGTLGLKGHLVLTVAAVVDGAVVVGSGVVSVVADMSSSVVVSMSEPGEKGEGSGGR